MFETKVAYMKFAFKVTVQVVRAEEPREIEAKVEGTPLGIVGRLTASSLTKLTEMSGATKIDYEVEAALTGKLGSLGQPVLRAKAKEMERQFAARLGAAFAAPSPGPSSGPPPARPLTRPLACRDRTRKFRLSFRTIRAAARDLLARARIGRLGRIDMTDIAAGALPWYRSLTRTQWRTLIAANLGWLFDGYETYALFLTVGPAMRSLLDPSQYPQIPAYIGTVVAITLLGWGIGGVLRRHSRRLYRPQAHDDLRHPRLFAPDRAYRAVVQLDFVRARCASWSASPSARNGRPAPR